MKILGFIIITLIFVIISVVGICFLIGWTMGYLEDKGFIDVRLNDPTTGRKNIYYDEYLEIMKRERKRWLKRKIKKLFKRK